MTYPLFSGTLAQIALGAQAGPRPPKKKGGKGEKAGGQKKKTEEVKKTLPVVEEQKPPAVAPLGPVKYDSVVRLVEMALNSVLAKMRSKYPNNTFESARVDFRLVITFDEEKKQFVLVFHDHPLYPSNMEVKGSAHLLQKDLAEMNDRLTEMNDMFYKFFPKLLLKELNDKYLGREGNPYIRPVDYIISVNTRGVGQAVAPQGVSKKQIAFEEECTSRRAFLRGEGLRRAIAEVGRAVVEDEKQGGGRVSTVENERGRAVVGNMEEEDTAVATQGGWSRRNFVGVSVLAFLGAWLYSKVGWAGPRRHGKKVKPVKKAPPEEKVEVKEKPDEVVQPPDGVVKKAEPGTEVKKDGGVGQQDGGVGKQDAGVIEPDAGVREVEPVKPAEQDITLTQPEVDKLLDQHLAGKLQPNGVTNLKDLSGKVGFKGPRRPELPVSKSRILELLKSVFDEEAIPSGVGLVAMEVLRTLPRISIKSLRSLERQGTSFSSIPFLHKNFMGRGILLMDVLETGEVSARLHIEKTIITFKFKVSEESYNKYYLLDPNAQDYKTTLKAARSGDVMALMRLYVFSHAENERESGGLIISDSNPDREFVYLTQVGNGGSTIRLNTAFIFGLYNLLAKEKVLLIKRDGGCILQYPYLMFDAAIPRGRIDAVIMRFKEEGRKVEEAEQTVLDFMGRWQTLRNFYAHREEEDEVESEEVDVRTDFVKVVQALLNTIIGREFSDGHDRPNEDVIGPITVLAKKLQSAACQDKNSSLHTSDEVTQRLMRYYGTLLVPLISVLAWKLVQDRGFTAEIERYGSGKGSSLSSAALATLAMGIINKRFVIGGADKFVSEHGLGFDVAKDIGIDFLTFSVFYTAMELLRKGSQV